MLFDTLLSLASYFFPGVFFIFIGVIHKINVPSFEKGFGYKSPQSILSKKTWYLAQASIANWSLRFGILSLIFSGLLFFELDLTLFEEILYSIFSIIMIPLLTKFFTDNMLKGLVERGQIHD